MQYMEGILNYFFVVAHGIQITQAGTAYLRQTIGKESTYMIIHTHMDSLNSSLDSLNPK